MAEHIIIIGYDDGKDIYNIQRDIPTMAISKKNYNKGIIDVENIIQGDRAIELFQELINRH